MARQTVGNERTMYVASLIVILLLAFALRIYSLEADAPLDISPSQELNLDGPVTIAAARDRAVFGSWNPHPGPLQPYRYYPAMNWLAYAFFSLIGVGYWQAKLISVLGGLFTVALTSAFAREQFGRRTSLFTALFIAISYVYVIYNRDPMAYTLATSGVALSLFCLGKGLRRPGWFALAGATMAFNTLFIKLPGVAILPAAAAGFGLRLWRAKAPISLRSLRPILLFAGGAALVGIAWLLLIYLPDSREVSRAYYVRTFSASYTFVDNLRFAVQSLLLFGVDFGFALRLLAVFVLSYCYTFYRLGQLLCRGADDLAIGEVISLTLLISSIIMLFFSGIRPMRFLITLIPPMCLVAALALDRWLAISRLPLPSRFGRLFPLFLQGCFTYLVYQILASLLMLWRIVKVGAGPNDPQVLLELDSIYLLLFASLFLAIALVMAFLVQTVSHKRRSFPLPNRNIRWVIAAIVLCTMVGSDLYQYWNWAKNPEFSIVDASRLLGARLDPTQTVLGGTYAYTLAFENDLPAVWFFSDTPVEERAAAGVTHFARSYAASDAAALQEIEADRPCAETFYLRQQLVKVCEVE